MDHSWGSPKVTNLYSKMLESTLFECFNLKAFLNVWPISVPEVGRPLSRQCRLIAIFLLIKQLVSPILCSMNIINNQYWHLIAVPTAVWDRSHVKAKWLDASYFPHCLNSVVVRSGVSPFPHLPTQSCHFPCGVCTCATCR